MTKIHRKLLKAISDVRAVNLDTSYGFQLNVPQMSEKLEEYFATSLRVAMSSLHFPAYERASEIERALFKQGVRDANYVFAGPGSPTYALAQWAPLHFGDDLLSVLNQRGTLCISSAASLTLGAYTAPIYEIYKVGDLSPQWRDGLNVLGAFGLTCAVIPHFDNAEGRNYDTRFCYLGEPRLLQLERQLPDGVATLGVDEHTAVIFDFEREELRVEGRSNGYWRLNGDSLTLENGHSYELNDLRDAAPSSRRPVKVDSQRDDRDPLIQLAEVAALNTEVGVAALARLVQLASTAKDGFVDPAPLIDAVLRARAEFRVQGHFDVADRLRDLLVNNGVEVQDTPSGAVWSLSSPS
jgi:hypothetical protein